MQSRTLLCLVALVASANRALGQPPANAPSPPPIGVANQVAARVNGQEIREIAVQRALRRVPAARHAEARPEILTFLIDNLLIDQYLTQSSIVVDPKDVDAKLKEVADDIKKEGSTYDKVMHDLMLSDTELRSQIVAQLRWDRYAASQATEQALRDLFDHNREMFDGTIVHARHILLTPPSADPNANAQAIAHLRLLKKQIEEQAMQAVAKLPAQADAPARQKERARVIEEAFATVASKESACPSKAQGGDLGWFPRAGNMVEPFAKAAFSLQPFQISEPVTSQFGHHLILVTDRRPGKDVKFDDLKDEVREVFCDRLREALVTRLRPTAQVVVMPPPKS